MLSRTGHLKRIFLLSLISIVLLAISLSDAAFPQAEEYQEETSTGSGPRRVASGTLLSVIPDSIDFGYVKIGDMVDTTFTIMNIGDENFNGMIFEASSPFSVDEQYFSFELAPLDSFVATIRYEPDVEGVRSTIIRIAATSGSSYYIDAFCTGFGYIEAVIVEPEILDFDRLLVGDALELSFTISNDSLDFLTGTIFESCEGFNIVSGEGSYSIPKWESLLVTVRFEPATEDVFECTVETGNVLLEDVYCSGLGLIESTTCSKEGDPGIYVGFEEEARDVMKGQTYCWDIAPANFGFVSNSYCSEEDTFCLHLYDDKGWTFSGDPGLEDCFILGSGDYQWRELCVTVPCDASVGEYDSLVVVMNYCDTEYLCNFDCADLLECEDPNWYNGNPFYSADTIVLHVIEAPPAISILIDSFYIVAQGQTQAYVPFDICNGDPCSPPVVYNYWIESTENIDGVFPQFGATDSIEGGNCETAHSVVDAGMTAVCTFDTLTIIAWDDMTGTSYDTAVQVLHVIEMCCVPLYSPLTIAVLVLALLLVSGVILRARRKQA